MNVRRPGREEVSLVDNQSSDHLMLSASTLRVGDPLGEFNNVRAQHNSDERLSMFWRVFGGTILSIGALIGVTLYNNLNATINDLRAEVSRTNEARGEMVKKEEFNTRTSHMWDRVQNLQELRVQVTGLKEQMNAQGDKTADAKAINEKLGLIEQRLRSGEDDHKTLAKAELTIVTLEQKAAVRETQLKTLEDDRKELAKQIQELRERLAKVEGVTETKPMAKSPLGKKE